MSPIGDAVDLALYGALHYIRIIITAVCNVRLTDIRTTLKNKLVTSSTATKLSGSLAKSSARATTNSGVA